MAHSRRSSLRLWLLLVIVVTASCKPGGGAKILDPPAQSNPQPLPSPTDPGTGIPQVVILSPLSIDSERGRLYAVAQVNSRPKLVTLDSRDGQLLAAWDSAGQLALDAARNRLVVDQGVEGIALLNADTGEVQGAINLPPQEVPPAPQINTQTGLIYAFRGSALHLLDPAIRAAVRVVTLKVERLVCDTPSGDAAIDRAAYDPAADRLYVTFISSTCIPWATMTIVALDGTTLEEIGRTETDINTQFAPFNKSLIGLSVSRLGPSLNWAWDGRARRYEHNGDFQGNPNGIAVDSGRELVYEAVGEVIRALDPSDGTIVAQATSPLAAGHRLAGYDPIGDTLYLVTATGRLFLWPAAALFGQDVPPVAAPSPLPPAPIRAVALSPNWGADQTMAAIVDDGCVNGAGRLFVMLNPEAGWLPGITGPDASCAAVSAVAFSPAYAQDSLLFAATHQPPAIIRSLDAGRSWTSADTPFPDGTFITTLLPSPDYANDQTIFALTAAGLLYRSRDGGRQWSLLDQRVDRVSIAGGRGRPVELYGSFAGRLLHSTDSGTRWSETGITPDSTELLLLAADQNTDGETTLIALTTAGRLARSLDGGATWLPVMETTPGPAQLVISAATDDGLRPVFLLLDHTITASYDGMASIWATTQVEEAGRFRPTAIALPPDFSAAPYLFVGTTDGQIIRVRADAQP